jgi:hypothetical protein
MDDGTHFTVAGRVVAGLQGNDGDFESQSLVIIMRDLTVAIVTGEGLRRRGRGEGSRGAGLCEESAGVQVQAAGTETARS